jgi:DNA-binding MarR family transcriptional regulator
VPNRQEDPQLEAASSWAKKYFLASRALMESVLRSYDLGNTQWYVLQVLSTQGPTNQRDITHDLQIERATLSAVISALVRKGLVVQLPDPKDQRQKVLRITPAGRALWVSLPDPIAMIAEIAFEGIPEADIATMNRVLREATGRLNTYRKDRK